MKGFPLLFLLVFALFTACSQGAEAQDAEAKNEDTHPTVIYLTRHAEKDESIADDPPLLPAGEIRAENMAKMLAGEKIAAVYATPFQRTRSTARPVAEANGLTITEYDGGGDPLEQVTEWKEKHRGQTIVVVGHSISTPNRLNALDPDGKYSDLSENEYSMLYRVTITGGKTTVEELHTSNSAGPGNK